MSNEANQNAINKLRQESELYSSLLRLKGNADFKKLVLQGYLVDECVKLISKSVKQSSDQALEAARATAYFDSWFNNLELALASSNEEYLEYSRNPETYFGDSTYVDDGRTLSVTAS